MFWQFGERETQTIVIPQVVLRLWPDTTAIGVQQFRFLWTYFAVVGFY